jgi:hypothetical protein
VRYRFAGVLNGGALKVCENKQCGAALDQGESPPEPLHRTHAGHGEACERERLGRFDLRHKSANPFDQAARLALQRYFACLWLDSTEKNSREKTQKTQKRGEEIMTWPTLQFVGVFLRFLRVFAAIDFSSGLGELAL